MGVYKDGVEPALGLSVSFQNKNRAKVLARLAKFAENFSQEQVHVREAPEAGTRVGHVYEDGSFNTRSYTFKLKKRLTPAKVRAIMKATGLESLTSVGNELTVYYEGDPNNAQSQKQFRQSIRRVPKLLGENGQGHTKGSNRIWIYGSGRNATHSYGSIAGRVLPGKTDVANASSRRVATRFAGRTVPVWEQAKGPISEDQKQLQREISDEYEAAPLNDLNNPNVKRAYDELADEVARQYESIPVRVELRPQKGGKKKDVYNNSSEMRRDVNWNNHLWIFATEAGTFGPEGSNFDASTHPLLAETKYRSP